MNLFLEIKEFVYSVVYHTPKEMLNEEEINRVMANGLVHFCEEDNVKNILKDGVVGNLRKPMKRKEIGYTWFYIFDESELCSKKKIIHSKGERKKYNAYIVIKNLSEEQILKLRIRRKIDCAVIFPDTLKTNEMTAHKLEQQRSESNGSVLHRSRL